MTSRERIYKILNFSTPDRIGLYDTFLESTVEAWREQGLPSRIIPHDFFDFDFDIIHIDKALENNVNKKDNKFRVLSFTEPFQELCNIYGSEKTLRKMASYPKAFKIELFNHADRILNLIQSILDKGHSFDGAWAWGDLAYNKGLFFSPSSYKNIIFPVHKKIFQFLSSKGFFIFFHSDGKIDDLIPYLIDANVRAIHPFEEKSNMDMKKLFRNYRKHIVFMGCMDIEKLVSNKPLIIKEKINLLQDNCSYVYHADYPIMPNISFKEYKYFIDTVRESGIY